MKFIVSSDKSRAVNAETMSTIQIGMRQHEKTWYHFIYADGIILSVHKKEECARKEFDKLLTALAQGTMPILYQMEDTV